MFRNIQMLLVEDDAVEVEYLTRSFHKHQFNSPVVYAYDGLEALSILKQNGTFSLRQPYFILLDMGLPRMNGCEFLKALRQDPNLKSTTVFVVTNSEYNEDIRAAYQAGVAGYILKKRAGENHINLIELLKAYLLATSPFKDHLFNPNPQKKLFVS